MWEAEFVSNETGYLAVKVYKESTECAACLLLAAYSEMQEERDKLREELLSKKEPGLDLRNSHSSDCKRCSN